MLRRFGQLRLFDQAASQTEFRAGRFRIRLGGCTVMTFGLREIARFECRLSQVKVWPGLLRLRIHGFFKGHERVGGLLIAQQKDSEIQFGFVERRFEFQRPAQFGYGFGVFPLEGKGERKIEVAGKIAGSRFDSLPQQRFSRSWLVRVEGLDPFRQKVGRWRTEKRPTARRTRPYFPVSV